MQLSLHELQIKNKYILKKPDSCFEYQLNKVGFQHKYIQSFL